MQRTLFLLAAFTALFLLATCQQTPPTGEEIIARCADALSGNMRFTDIKTISLTGVYPDHENPVQVQLARPNRFRTEGAGGFTLVFDGSRAAFLSGGPGGEGPELVSEEEWKDFEVDIAFHYPALFEFTPAYVGLIDTTGRREHKFEVVLPMGGVMTYYVDPETYLINEAVTKVVIHGTEYSWGRRYLEYQDVGGVRYFKTFEYKGREGMQTGWFESVAVNEDIPEERFALPASLLESE